MAITALELHRLYLAYFGRPADAGGMDFYLSPSAHWKIFAGPPDVTVGFSESPESQALYGSSFGAEQIDLIYRNLFGRPAEPEGLAYWLGEVSAGRIQPAGAAYAILVGAQNEDLLAVNNKLAICQEFFAELDTLEEKAAYAGSAAADAMRAFIATVGASAASLDAARNGLHAKLVELLEGMPLDLVFTDGADDLVGGAQMDTFAAQIGGKGATLQAGDKADAGAGFDTLLVDFAADVDFPAAELRGFEALHVANHAGAPIAIDASGFEGVRDFRVAGGASALRFHGLGEGQVGGFTETDTALDASFEYADGVKVATVVASYDVAGQLEVGGRDVEETRIGGTVVVGGHDHSFASIALTGTKNALAHFFTAEGSRVEVRHLTAAQASDVRIRLSGDGSFAFGALHDGFVSLDASDLMGHVELFTLDTSEPFTQFDFTGSNGADTFHVRALLAGGEIDGGAGTDTLVVHDESFWDGAARYTGFERVVIADGAYLDAALLGAGVKEVAIRMDDPNLSEETGVFNLSAGQAANLSLEVRDGAGSPPQLRLGVAEGVETLRVALTGNTPEIQLGEVRFTNARVVEIASHVDYAVNGLYEVGAMLELAGTGKGDVHLELGGANLGTDDDVQRAFDFSGLQGRLTLLAAQAQQDPDARGLRIKDGSNADEIFGTMRSDTVIFGGNADQLELGAAGDVFDFNGKAGSVALGTGVTFRTTSEASSVAGVEAGETFDAATHFDEALCDSILGIRAGTAFGATAGTRFSIDTGVAGPSVQVKTAAAMVMGQANVLSHAHGFALVVGPTGAAYLMQDTDGNRGIDAGEFMVRLVGAGSFAASDFSHQADGVLVFESKA